MSGMLSGSKCENKGVKIISAKHKGRHIKGFAMVSQKALYRKRTLYKKSVTDT